MVITRSQSMAISEEIKEYFTSLIEPLATNEGIKKLFSDFQESVILNLEKRITTQDEKIEKLEANLAIRENTINILLKRVEGVELQADDNEQYSRRSCLRIHNIHYDPKEKENTMLILEECYKKMNVPFDESEIDRVHRIGKPITSYGKLVKSIIVKFKSWEPRKRFYQARPKGKPGEKPFFVSNDLTIRRYNLLKHAKGVTDNNESVAYTFADINCSLGLKTHSGDFHYFNNISTLEDILYQLN